MFPASPQAGAVVSEYVLELSSFPYGKHADQVDSTSQALACAIPYSRKRDTSRASTWKQRGTGFCDNRLAAVG